MIVDQYGKVCLTSDEVFNSLYSGKIHSLRNILFDTTTVDQFNKSASINFDNFEKLKEFKEEEISLDQFDKINQENWFMPEKYQTFDIVNWLFEQCQTEQQKQRVHQELTLFTKYRLIKTLQYFKFLVDTMRDNQIVWGVGRGSSVSSYILFLIGIHKINSLQYNLDIHEFLK